MRGLTARVAAAAAITAAALTAAVDRAPAGADVPSPRGGMCGPLPEPEAEARALAKTADPEMSSCLATLYNKHKTSPVTSRLTYQEPNTIESYLNSVNSKNNKRLHREIDRFNDQEENINRTKKNNDKRAKKKSKA